MRPVAGTVRHPLIMMRGMTKSTRSAAARSAATSATGSAASSGQLESPEQLSLLAASHLPVQFRLDRRTRERGLANIAAIRRLLAARGHGTPVPVSERAAAKAA